MRKRAQRTHASRGSSGAVLAGTSLAGAAARLGAPGCWLRQPRLRGSTGWLCATLVRGTPFTGADSYENPVRVTPCSALLQGVRKRSPSILRVFCPTVGMVAKKELLFAAPTTNEQDPHPGKKGRTKQNKRKRDKYIYIYIYTYEKKGCRF